MKDFIVITAFRDTGDPYRRRNLAACIASVAKNFPEAEHVVAEQCDGPESGKWFESQGFSEVTHDMVDMAIALGGTVDGLFHKPVLLNTAVQTHPGHKVYMMVDADVYLERNLAEYAMAECCEGKLVFPYGDAIYMDELDTRCKVAGNELWGGEKDHGVTIRRQTGLTVAFTYNDFKAVRGFDVEFAGWGAEDDAFMYKFLRTGREVMRNTDKAAIAYHMFHPKVNTKEYTSDVLYKKNRVLCACVRRMSDDDFAEYLAGTVEMNDLVDKYRKMGRLEIALDWLVVKQDIPAGIMKDVVLHMDTTIYDIDRTGEMSIDKIMNEVVKEDGWDGVIEFVEGVLGKIPDLPANIKADVDRWYARAKEQCGIS
jgi:hypothetical protein